MLDIDESRVYYKFESMFVCIHVYIQSVVANSFRRDKG